MFGIKIQNIVSEAQCYEQFRSVRWDNGVHCPNCGSDHIVKNGGNPNQRYICRNCNKHFDDLTDTIFSGHKLSLKTWILCLYFMGLNLSNSQIARELDLSETTAHELTSKLRAEISKKKLISVLAERLNSMRFMS